MKEDFWIFYWNDRKVPGIKKMIMCLEGQKYEAKTGYNANLLQIYRVATCGCHFIYMYTHTHEG